MEVGGGMVVVGVHCCHRNAKCGLQSEAKANLYAGRHQPPREPCVLCVCVRVGVLKRPKRGPLLL